MSISIGSQNIITVKIKDMFIFIRSLSEIILQGTPQTVKNSYPRDRNMLFPKELF